MDQKFCGKCGAGLEGQPTHCPGCGELIKKKGMSTCAIVAIVLGFVFVFALPVMGIIASIAIPAFIKGRERGQIVSCKTNLKNIATAVEAYALDYQGRYPSRLEYLTQSGYIKTIPTCLTAQKATYQYTVTVNPDIYTAWCEGEWHSSYYGMPNYPQYESIQGLIEPQ